MKARKYQKLKRAAGRPRRQGVDRYENGRIIRGQDRETEKDVVRTVTEARVRQLGVDMSKARDPRLGSAVGRLESAGNADGLSRDQADVLTRWGELHSRYVRQQGFTSENPKSPGMVMVARGLSLSPEPDEDAIMSTRRAWADAYRALSDYATRDHGIPTPYEIMRRVVIEDYAPGNPLELGNLRIAANILRQLWRV